MTFRQELASWWSPGHLPTANVPDVGGKAPSTEQLQFPAMDGNPTMVTFLRHCGCPCKWTHLYHILQFCSFMACKFIERLQLQRKLFEISDQLQPPTQKYIPLLFLIAILQPQKSGCHLLAGLAKSKCWWTQSASCMLSGGWEYLASGMY